MINSYSWLAELEKIKLQLIALSNSMTEKTNALKLYETAKSLIGQKLVPPELADLGCAASLNAVHKKSFGREIGGGASTFELYQALLKDPTFIKVENAQVGDIIISPTTLGNGSIPNGHCGMVGKYLIMSNNSPTGTWEANLSQQHWNAWYGKRGGFPVIFFRKL